VAEEIEELYGIDVEVSGDALDEQTVTAWFADQSADDVIRVVCKVLAARCSREDGTVMINVQNSSSDGGT
jgi:hypothetical protein